MFLSCTSTDHVGSRVRYALLDITGDAERALIAGKCPMCPAQEIPRELDRLPVCPCCGSTWTVSDDTATCLPGAATEYMS